MRVPNYSLALLDPRLQQEWLKSVLIFLYKYDTNSQVDSQSLYHIVHICLAILKNSNHSCTGEKADVDEQTQASSPIGGVQV